MLSFYTKPMQYKQTAKSNFRPKRKVHLAGHLYLMKYYLYIYRYYILWYN